MEQAAELVLGLVLGEPVTLPARRPRVGHGQSVRRRAFSLWEPLSDNEGALQKPPRRRYHDIIAKYIRAQLVVRNLDDDVKAKLQQRARQHGRSTEEEVREILRKCRSE
jgi:hypothetical protein